MLRDTLFTEPDSHGLLHPLVASRILHLYEMKHPTEVELLNGLMGQGYDKEFRIERLKTVFCPQMKRRVEEVISSCVLKVSDLRSLHRNRHKNFMALVEASWSALKGGGSSCGRGGNEEGGQNQCKKKARKSAVALSAGSSRATGSPRATPKSSNAQNGNAGDKTRMSVTPVANAILPQPSSSNGDEGKSRGDKRRLSWAPGDNATRTGRTPSRSTPGTAGRKPGSTNRRLSKKDKKEGKEQVKSSLVQEAEENEEENKATVALAIQVSSNAETRRRKWLAAVEENDRRFKEVEEGVHREIAKAEELHRARNLELFRWSVDEQRGKHVGSGNQGPPPMSVEPGDSVCDPSSAVAVNTDCIPDARLRTDKYLRAVEENDVRLRKQQEHLKKAEELAKKAHHARSLELFAWDVEERMGRHGTLGNDGPPSIV